MRADSCSAIGARLHEPLAGSAPAATRWLVLEQCGPWGRDPLRESDLPGAVAAELAAAADAHGVKVLFTRRTRRRMEDGARTAFLASTERGNAWVERHALADAAAVGGLDLGALGRGERTDPAAAWEEAVYLVCTHGERDPCCAERGRPLHRALDAHRPGGAWQCGHLGGHRFAPTLLALPHGLCYGRVPAAGAAALAAAHERGRVIPELLRGRAGDHWAAQVADAAIRSRDGLRGVDEVELLGVDPVGEDAAVVELGLPEGRRARAEVRRAPAALPRPVSCGKAPEDPMVPELVSLT